MPVRVLFFKTINAKSRSEVSMAHHFKSARSATVQASAVVALMITMHAAQADTTVYKYTGPDGVTVYSQSLPENYSPAAVTTIPMSSARNVRRTSA